MAECFEAKEDRTFCVAGLQLPLTSLFTREGAARAFMLRPLPNDVILSSYPRCDSVQVDSMVWKLLYTDLRRPPFDPATGRFLPCLEMTAGDLSYVHEHAERCKLPRLYKTYFPFRLIPFCRQTRYVYVVRSPWEACTAHYRFLTSIGAVDASFDEFFERFLEGEVPFGSFFRHVVPWNKRMGEGNILILCREHVEHNPRSALFKIAAFLGDRYLRLLTDNEQLEKDILDECSRPHDPRPARCCCSERQMDDIVSKVSHHFRDSSIEFLWLNLLQKQLPVR